MFAANLTQLKKTARFSICGSHSSGSESPTPPESVGDQTGSPLLLLDPVVPRGEGKHFNGHYHPARASARDH